MRTLERQMALSEVFQHRFDDLRAFASTQVKRGTSLCRQARLGWQLDTIRTAFFKVLIWCLFQRRECCPSEARRACNQVPTCPLFRRTFGASVPVATSKVGSQQSKVQTSNFQISQRDQNPRSSPRKATQSGRLSAKT